MYLKKVVSVLLHLHVVPSVLSHKFLIKGPTLNLGNNQITQVLLTVFLCVMKMAGKRPVSSEDYVELSVDETDKKFIHILGVSNVISFDFSSIFVYNFLDYF